MVIKAVKGNLRFSAEWTMFAPLKRGDEALAPDVLVHIPATTSISGNTVKAERVQPFRNQFHFKSHIGKAFNADYFQATGYFFIPVHAESEGVASIGFGGDNWVQAWLNGKPLFEGKEVEAHSYPPKISDHLTEAHFTKGENILVIRIVCGIGASVLAVGGPDEIRKGDFRSIIDDPLMRGSCTLAGKSIRTG